MVIYNDAIRLKISKLKKILLQNEKLIDTTKSITTIIIVKITFYKYYCIRFIS